MKYHLRFTNETQGFEDRLLIYDVQINRIYSYKLHYNEDIRAWKFTYRSIISGYLSNQR